MDEVLLIILYLENVDDKYCGYKNMYIMLIV